eukprot:scaffold24.g2933.t1
MAALQSTRSSALVQPSSRALVQAFRGSPAIGFASARPTRRRAGAVALPVRAAAAPDRRGYQQDQSVRIERVSFGSILTPLGLGLMTYGFGAFFQLLPGGDASSLLLVYGFPILLLGFALSYAQASGSLLLRFCTAALVSCLSLLRVHALHSPTPVREDVTRYRYGDEQHLDEALTRMFRFGQAGGVPRRLAPVLTAVREEATNGAYTLVLEFSPKQAIKGSRQEALPREAWEERREKFEARARGARGAGMRASFFGPGIIANLDFKEGGRVDVALVVDGSGAGRGGGNKKDVLPPLMPGLKARSQ